MSDATIVLVRCVIVDDDVDTQRPEKKTSMLEFYAMFKYEHGKTKVMKILK